jgi:hypothetical protein
MLFRVVCVAWLLLAAIVPGRASDVYFRKDSIMVFAGQYADGGMGDNLNPFRSHEDAYIIGGAFTRTLFDLGWNLYLVGEVGLAGRYGDRASAEVWGGPGFRIHGIPLGGLGWLSLGVTVGLSAVTGPVGSERDRAIYRKGDPTLLFYFAPELALRLAAWPDFEIVYRMHHRSGFQYTLGHMLEGANAHVIGIRWRQ